MKSLFFLLFVSLQAAGQFHVEWRQNAPELRKFGGYVTGLLEWQNSIFMQENDGTLHKYHPDGSLLFADTFAYRGVDKITIHDALIHGTGVNLYKADSEGSLKMQTRCFVTGSSSMRLRYSCIINNSLYCSTQSRFAKFDLNGQHVLSHDLGKYYVLQDFIPYKDHIFTVASSSGSNITHLLKFDTLGQVVADHKIPSYTNKIILDKEGNIFVFFSSLGYDDYVLKLDSAAQPVWTVQTPTMVVKNAVVYGDSIFVCGQNKGGFSHLQILSASTGDFISEQSFDLSDDDIWDEKATHIVVKEQEIYLAGIAGYGPEPHPFIAKLRNSKYVSVKEQTKEMSAWRVFPNPTHSALTISGPSTKGKCLLKNNVLQTLREYDFDCTLARDFTMDLTGTPPGVYFLEISTQSSKQLLKVVKQ